jgi:hypothetical protein
MNGSMGTGSRPGVEASSVRQLPRLPAVLVEPRPRQEAHRRVCEVALDGSGRIEVHPYACSISSRCLPARHELTCAVEHRADAHTAREQAEE